MPDQLTVGFYASNEGTEYPFSRSSDAFSRPFVDAQVSVPAGFASDEVALTAWNPLGGFEIRAGNTVVIPLGTPVAATLFGDYAIWEARTPTASATLVFAISPGVPAMIEPRYVFQDRAVSRGTAQELYVAVGGTEVAGPGGTLSLTSGSNVNLATETLPSGDAVVTINAQFSSKDKSGCEDMQIERGAGIVTINGLSPDANGNFTFLGESTYIVERAKEADNLVVVNIGEPCCDCPDYIAMFKSLRAVSADYNDIAKEILKAQDAYRQLLAYTRFILQSPIVGGVGSTDSDRIAT